MKDTAQYISLDTAIYEYINRAQLTDAHYLRLFPIAVRGLEQIYMDITGEPVTRKLGVLPNKTVQLPADYKGWRKIGIINDRGEIATLIHNPKLSGYAATDDNRLSVNTSVASSPIHEQWDFVNYYDNGQCYNLYGVPGGTTNYGEFKVLEDQGIILLDKDFEYDHIMLEHMACPVANGDFMIPVVALECLVAWMGWKDIQFLPSGRRANSVEKRDRKRDFFNEKRNMRPKAQPIRVQDLNEVFLKGTRLSLKY